ncbi:hypothetical protein CTI14_54930, partial [Methylobacterium radiotolerans]
MPSQSTRGYEDTAASGARARGSSPRAASGESMPIRDRSRMAVLDVLAGAHERELPVVGEEPAEVGAEAVAVAVLEADGANMPSQSTRGYEDTAASGARARGSSPRAASGE